jgi:IclR family acetate operon transcriptional repressor
MPTKNDRPVKSVEKALRLLNHLTDARRPLSLGELAARSGWPKSTVYGLLAALREGGAVEQRPEDGYYMLGIRLFEYGCAVSDSWDILSAASGPMLRVSQMCGESVFLSTLDRGDVLILDRAVSIGSLRVVSEIGARLPLHCTSQGKLLLAHQPAGERRRLLRESTLTAFTPHTICDPDLLEAGREEILAQGYAVENGEHRIGLRSISAPVQDARGEVRWAVTVSGMFRRPGSEEFTASTALVLEAAADISKALGFRA